MSNCRSAGEQRTSPRILVLLLGTIALICGCAATNYDTWYRIGLAGARVPATNAWTSAAGSIPAPARSADQFEDERLAARWSLWDWNIKLKLENKTAEPLTILWPEASVAWNGEIDALQIKDQRVAQAAVLPPKGSASYHVYPLSLLHWISWGDPAAGRGSWTSMGASAPIFGLSLLPDQSPETRQARARRAIGHHVKVLLPVQAGGERVNYVFRMDIKDARNYGVRY